MTRPRSSGCHKVPAGHAADKIRASHDAPSRPRGYRGSKVYNLGTNHPWKG